MNCVLKCCIVYSTVCIDILKWDFKSGIEIFIRTWVELEWFVVSLIESENLIVVLKVVLKVVLGVVMKVT